MTIRGVIKTVLCETLLKSMIRKFSIIIIFFSIFYSRQALSQRKPQKDTIYYVSFLDLVEKGLYDRWKKYNTDYDLAEEKEIMNKVIEKSLKKYFVLYPIPDSCYKKLKTDSISRRSEKFADSLCSSCFIHKKVILLDAVWEYLSKNSFDDLVIRDVYISAGLRTKNYWVIGAWWHVRASVYSPLESKFIYQKTNNYSQWQNKRPTKKHGANHMRFFKRPVKKIKRFLTTLHN